MPPTRIVMWVRAQSIPLGRSVSSGCRAEVAVAFNGERFRAVLVGTAACPLALMLFAQYQRYAISGAAECDLSCARCERIGGLKFGQPGVEIGCVDLCGNRQALFDLAI
jgi:hypothetical protein